MRSEGAAKAHDDTMVRKERHGRKRRSLLSAVRAFGEHSRVEFGAVNAPVLAGRRGEDAAKLADESALGPETARTIEERRPLSRRAVRAVTLVDFADDERQRTGHIA